MRKSIQRSGVRKGGSLLIAMVLSSGLIGAQANSPQEKTPPSDQQTAPVQTQPPAPGVTPATPKGAALSKEEQRQARLLADTNRLYELVQELKAEVAKSSKDTLSLEVVKKAAEVEKLAKSLKERMRSE